MSTLKYVLRKFGIRIGRSERMPREIRDTDRVTLAELFAELGFKRGVEIGVNEGDYSETLCKVNPGLHLACIDPWDADPNFPHRLGQSSAMEIARKKLAPYDASLLQMTSHKAIELDLFADGSLDFVYIDGDHTLPYITQDLCEWSKKVRPGGIVSGHDWVRMAKVTEDHGNFPVHVCQALLAYTDAYRIRPWFVLGAKEKVRSGPGRRAPLLEKRDLYRSWFWVKE